MGGGGTSPPSPPRGAATEYSQYNVDVQSHNIWNILLKSLGQYQTVPLSYTEAFWHFCYFLVG